DVTTYDTMGRYYWARATMKFLTLAVADGKESPGRRANGALFVGYTESLTRVTDRNRMPSPADELARSMADAWNASDPERVVALAGQASGTEMDQEGILLLLGLAHQRTNRHAQAAKTFERLCRMRPEVSAYWNNLGVASRHSGNVATSERAFLKAKSLAPADAEVHYNLGLLRIQQRRWSAAREALLDAVQLSPGFVEARLQAAYACHVCGDVEGEEAMLEGADGWPPQPAEQALILASILSMLGRLETALEVLAQARLPEGPSAQSVRFRIAAQRAAMYERNNLLEHARHELRQLPLNALDALPSDADQVRIDGWRAHAVMAMREGRDADA